MSIVLQNMSEKRKNLVQKHQDELDSYWQGFFKEVSNILQRNTGVESIDISFSEDEHYDIHINSGDIKVNCTDPQKQTVADDLLKIIYTNIDSFLQDYYRLDCDDTIRVTADGVEGRFRRYGNWNIENKPAPESYSDVIKEMEIRGVVDHEGAAKVVVVTRDELLSLHLIAADGTVPENLFFVKACDYIERTFDYNTDEAKLDVWR